jgi:cytochrome P450
LLRATAVGGRLDLWARFGPLPKAVTRTQFDPLDRDVLADPYPHYSALHEGPRLQFSPARRIWIVHRYDDVRAAAREHSALVSGDGITLVRSRLPMMISMDRPGHARLRPLLARPFAHDALEGQRPMIERIVAERLDRLGAGGDAVAELATPVPVEVIAELLGVPADDFARFRAWSDVVVEGFAFTPSLRALASALRVWRATLALHAYFGRTLRGRPAGMLGQLLDSADAGKLTAGELRWFAFLLLIAGNETTTNLLGALMLCLAADPDLYDQLRADPQLIGSAIEEALRLHSPIQGLYRAARTDYAVGEATIPRGARVLLLFGAANRDPARFHEPDRFVLGREPSDHLAFGTGIHFCLGAHLARLEAEVLLRSLLSRTRRIALAGEPRFTRNPTLRGLAALPIELS